MSEREILLRLPGAGEKHCGKCQYRQVILLSVKRTDPGSCALFRKGLMDDASGDFVRLPECLEAEGAISVCLAAERAAAELREDARYKARWERLKASANPWVLREMRKLEAENE